MRVLSQASRGAAYLGRLLGRAKPGGGGGPAVGAPSKLDKVVAENQVLKAAAQAAAGAAATAAAAAAEQAKLAAKYGTGVDPFEVTRARESCMPGQCLIILPACLPATDNCMLLQLVPAIECCRPLRIFLR